MVRRPNAPLKPRAAMPAQGDPGAAATDRPPICAEGRQAPAFAPTVFAEAGILLAREAAEAGLLVLSSEALALASRLLAQDWSPLARHMGRAGAALPQPQRLAGWAEGTAAAAEAARRLLYGLAEPIAPETSPAPATETAQMPTPVPPAPGRTRTEAADPDLAAIRALMTAKPEEAPSAAPAAPVSPLPDRAAPTLPPVLARAAHWGIVRVLAGTVLAFATPLGYGRALWRHLDGQDLREIVADCHRPRTN